VVLGEEPTVPRKVQMEGPTLPKVGTDGGDPQFQV
jgi:hypothetical protein